MPSLVGKRKAATLADVLSGLYRFVRIAIWVMSFASLVPDALRGVWLWRLESVVRAIVAAYLCFKFWAEKQENDSYGPMAWFSLLLLALEVLLQNIELVFYVAAERAAGLVALFWVALLSYDSLWRGLYKFQEIDDLSYHLLFGLAGVVHHIYHRQSLWPVLAWTIGGILSRLGWVWYQQWVIYKSGNGEPDDFIRVRTVTIQCSETSGDVGHFYVTVGEDHTFELFKSGGTITARPLPQTRVLGRRRHVHNQVFFVPFVQYGVVGFSTWSDERLARSYSQQFGSMDAYNSSFDSCQEFAFRLVDQLCSSPIRFNMQITSLKAVLTVCALYAVPLIYVLCTRVTVHYI